MLEIVALCSCACLACLWCALAFEVAKNKCGGRWCTTLRNPCEWRWTKCKCVERVIGQRNSPCKNSCLCSPCAFPSYKFVCKVCRRVKPECICAKLFWHNVAVDHSYTKYQLTKVSCKSPSPNLICQETSRSLPEQVLRGRQSRNNKTKQTKKQRRSMPKSILRKQCTEKENRDVKKCDVCEHRI